MNENMNVMLKEVAVLKEQLSALRPLPEEALKKIQDALDIEYTYESNRIEGNTAHFAGNSPCSKRRRYHFRKVHA